MYTFTLLMLIGLLFDNCYSGCCYNTDCSYTYEGEDKCFMEARYPSQSNEGFCWGANCIPWVGSDGSCRSKVSYLAGCKNSGGNYDNNYCVTNFCSDSTGKCSYRDEDTACLPTPQPTTPKPTAPKPTPPPTKQPTPLPTKKPTSTSPTPSPTVEPTKIPSMEPSPIPTMEPTAPTASPTFSPTNKPGLSSHASALLFGSLGAISLCIVGIVWYLGRNKQKMDKIHSELMIPLMDGSTSVVDLKMKQELIIRNAMVILLAIGEYEKNPKDPEPELKGGIPNLNGIELDIKNLHRAFGPSNLNYTIYPAYHDDEKPKLSWTQNEIKTFLYEKARFLKENLDRFDGLIVAMSGHGLGGYICTSDCKMMQQAAIHRIFSQRHPTLRKIPRIFLFDCCDGQYDCSKGIKTIKRKHSDTSKLSKSLSIEEEKDTSKKFSFEDIELTESQTGKHWKKHDKNPDYRLVEIHAANRGFQSKMNMRKGSYMLSGFVDKTIGNVNNKKYQCIYEIFDEIQKELEDKGKQHITTTFHNQTRWVTLKPNEALLVNYDDDDDKEEKDVYNDDASSDNDSEGEHTKDTS